jgi:MinD superfamily P-loop ATPase
MKGLSLIQPIDARQLEKETLRIYEVCDGCRRCFNLCPSFNTLLDRIDVYEGDVAKLTPAITSRSSMNVTTANSASTTARILRLITMKSISPI